MPYDLQALQQGCSPLLEVEGACLRFPGGAKICFNFAQLPSDPGEVARQIVAASNTALAPLQPIFTLLDALLAIGECVKGVPEAITQLDPSTLILCIPDLLEKLAALASLAPQISLIPFLADLVELLVKHLTGMRSDIARLATTNAEILAAEALQEGRPGLQVAVSCARDSYNAEVAMLNAANGPLNELLQLVLGLLSVIGVQFNGTAALDTFSENIAEALAPIDALIDTLTVIRNLIPV